MAVIHRITTDATLLDDLRASLRQRGVAWDGTFAGLVGAISAFGVQPHEDIAVEVGQHETGCGRITVERGHDGVWEVRQI